MAHIQASGTRRLRGLSAVAGGASLKLLEPAQNTLRVADLQLTTFPSGDGIGALPRVRLPVLPVSARAPVVLRATRWATASRGAWQSSVSGRLTCSWLELVR